MKIFIVVLLSFVAVDRGLSQDTTGTVVNLTEKMGPTIDLEERNYYQMFLNYKDFKSAILLQRTDGSYIFKIISKKADDPSVSISWFPGTNEEILRIRHQIDPAGKYESAPSPSDVPVFANVRVKETEYGELERVNKIFVATKDGQKHEIVDFKFTGTHLIGDEKSNRIEIGFLDIDSLMISGFRDQQGRLIPAEEFELPPTGGICTTCPLAAMVVLGLVYIYFRSFKQLD
jgi:hypothetical protein